MAPGHEEETSEQAVNPSLLLRAMQTAIAQGLRARNEPPEELPPELTVALGSSEGARAAIVFFIKQWTA
jgi:hypothetical protein